MKTGRSQPLATTQEHWSTENRPVALSADGSTLVRWSSTFKRKNPSDNPPDAENDAAGVKLITGIYQSGLANLKKMLEGG